MTVREKESLRSAWPFFGTLTVIGVAVTTVTGGAGIQLLQLNVRGWGGLTLAAALVLCAATVAMLVMTLSTRLKRFEHYVVLRPTVTGPFEAAMADEQGRLADDSPDHAVDEAAERLWGLAIAPRRSDS
jgi:hypothetical protein